MAFAFLFIILLLAIALLALARGVLARNDGIAIVCIVLLVAYAEGIWFWPPLLSGDHFFVSVMLAGFRPFESASLIARAANAVPLISAPSIGIGAFVGAIGAWLLWRNRRPRLAAFFWICVTPVMSLITAEMLVAADMRHVAAEQFPAGYCTVLTRYTVPAMIQNQAYEERYEHVVLVADRKDYFWSFRERRFVERGNSNLGYRCDGRKL